MRYRTLGKTGFKVSEVSFGAWAIGGSWGNVSDKDSLKALNKAIDLGVNFIDTADVYGKGRSEKLIGKLLKERDEEVFVATKAGRMLNPHEADGYNANNLEKFINQSLMNLDVDAIDLLQLHTPPTKVFYMPEVFDFLDDMVKKGKLKNYGVSVETVEEGLKAIEYPNVATVQIIFNMFRLRPSELFFKQAALRKVGVIARVPLVSGLLTGKMSKDSTFEDDDHRKFNREGEAFDKGETFSGVDFETGLDAVEKLKELKPEGMTMAQFALKWILMFEEVSCIIPGGKNELQVEDNVATSDLGDIDKNVMGGVKNVYDKYIKEQVHQRW